MKYSFIRERTRARQIRQSVFYVADLKRKFSDGISIHNTESFIDDRIGHARPQAFSGGFVAASPPAAPVADFDSDITINEKEGGEETQERSYLPETWLWLLKRLP